MIKMGPGYAYKYTSGHVLSSESWENVAISEDMARRAKYIGRSALIGNHMVLFKLGRSLYAQPVQNVRETKDGCLPCNLARSSSTASRKPSLFEMLQAQESFKKRLPKSTIKSAAASQYVQCFERVAPKIGQERAHRSCLSAALDEPPHYGASARRRVVPFVPKIEPKARRSGYCMYCDKPTHSKRYSVCARCADIIEGRRMGDVEEIRLSRKQDRARHVVAKLSKMPPYRLAKCVGKKVMMGQNESMAILDCDFEWDKLRKLGIKIRKEAPPVIVGGFEMGKFGIENGKSRKSSDMRVERIEHFARSRRNLASSVMGVFHDLLRAASPGAHPVHGWMARAPRTASRIYEITSVDTGRTVRMTEAKARATFGKDEWKEIKAGYLPHLVVVPVG